MLTFKLLLRRCNVAISQSYPSFKLSPILHDLEQEGKDTDKGCCPKVVITNAKV